MWVGFPGGRQRGWGFIIISAKVVGIFIFLLRRGNLA